ncbi:MAG: YaiO family outer membrane beta-barrel protein [Bacteroidales bacterium]
MKQSRVRLIGLVGLMVWALSGISQESHPDSLFRQAQASAYASDYARAQMLCEQILAQSPQYHDARILLSSTYAWQGQYDTALVLANRVLQDLPKSLDAIKLKVRIFLWSKNYEKLHRYAKTTLATYPQNEWLLYHKALSLEKLTRTKEALEVYQHLLKIQPSHKEATEALERLRHLLRRNRITLQEQYDMFFDAQSAWNLASLAYTRETDEGSITARVNHAYRFQRHGFQYELEAYPIFREGTYAYLNYGYADNSLFPTHRIGIEPYQRLPLGFEVSAGIRYLKFATTDVPIYTGSLSKYFQNWWVSFRPFFSANGNTQTQSYQFISRYYLQSSFDYIGLRLGSGITPDMPGVDNQLLESSELSTQFTIQASYQRLVAKRLLLNSYIMYYKEQNSQVRYEDRITLQLSVSWMF